MTARPRTYDVLGILVKFHAFPDEVQGKYCLVEALVPPGAGAPPNHHAGETEAFHMLDGEIEFMVAGVTRVARAGDHVSIPDGAVHGFQAVGDRPARVLILNAPGRMHDAFFTGIGEALPEEQTSLPEPKAPDFGKLMKLADEVGMTLVSPAEA